jgi:dimethylhistidine N-methyltransferase
MPHSAAFTSEAVVAAREAFAQDVQRGLSARPKRLPPRWLYDSLGSALFEAIGQLPWYRITRAELELLARCAPAVASQASGPVDLIELGVGDGRKLLLVARALAAARRLGTVHLVDVSARALEAGAQAMARDTRAVVIGHQATFEDGLDRAAAQSGSPRLVLFLGSNIGNFDPPESQALLRRLAQTLASGDRLLLGLDLVKPARDLLLAYDDPLGVTAAFNRNLLQRLNAELGASFDLATFRHEARWNAPHSRIEMHLVSLRRQEVEVPGAGITARFENGETIWTESSYKYDRGTIPRLAASARLRIRSSWFDEEAGFALTLMQVEKVEEVEEVDK